MDEDSKMSAREDKKAGQIFAFIISGMFTALAGIFWMACKLSWDINELSVSLAKIAEMLEKQQRSN